MLYDAVRITVFCLSGIPGAALRYLQFLYFPMAGPIGTMMLTAALMIKLLSLFKTSADEMIFSTVS